MKISEIEDANQLATKLDLQKAMYDLTWRLIGLIGIQTVLILGAVYFLLGDIKADLRDERSRITQQHP